MRLICTLLIVCLIASCSSSGGKFEEVPEGGSANSQQETVVIQEQPAVCVWDNISVRETANSKGKWVTSVSVGESLTYLGQTAIDSTDKNREYLSIRLADGTEGWSLADFIVIDSEVAVFADDASLYKRPDLLTKTESKFAKFGIVAISDSEGDWLEAVGRREDGKWIQTGWVKKANLSTESIDVAVAKFINAALAKETEEEQKMALNEIIDNPDLMTSQFIDDVSKILDEMEVEVESEEMTETDSTAVSE